MNADEDEDDDNIIEINNKKRKNNLSKASNGSLDNFVIKKKK